MQAQRLAAAEALIKNAHSNAGLGGSGNTADLEAKIKKLAADVRLLKERMGDMKPAVTQVRASSSEAAAMALLLPFKQQKVQSQHGRPYTSLAVEAVVSCGIGQMQESCHFQECCCCHVAAGASH